MWKVFIKVTYIVKDSWCVVIVVLPKEMVRKEGSASAHCLIPRCIAQACERVDWLIGYKVFLAARPHSVFNRSLHRLVGSISSMNSSIRQYPRFLRSLQPGSGFIASSLLGRGILLVDRGTSYDIFVNRIPFHEEINFRAMAFTYLYLSCKFVVI